MKTMGYAALNATTRWFPSALNDAPCAGMMWRLRSCGPGAHSDLHQTRDDWKEWGRPFTPAFPGTKLLAG